MQGKGDFMKEINETLLKECAHNLMFDMKEEEYQTLLNEFHIVQEQLSMIGEIDGLDQEEPMTFPFDCAISYLREDEEKENLTREEALKNAKDVFAGQIKLPKVVG